MATVLRTRRPVAKDPTGTAIPPLENGDRLTAAEFERRYEAMPHLKRAELIEGRVYVQAAVRFVQHGGPHADLAGWLFTYRVTTPGVESGDNTSIRLDPKNEPQPDVFLRIAPECGGQSRTDGDGFVRRMPELIAEVAASSVSYDLHEKLDLYRRHGAQEYIVWKVLEDEILWYRVQRGRFTRLKANKNGVYKSAVFPGLWLHSAALINGEMTQVLNVLREGLATPEHGKFVERLEVAKSKS